MQEEVFYIFFAFFVVGFADQCAVPGLAAIFHGKIHICLAVHCFFYLLAVGCGEISKLFKYVFFHCVWFFDWLVFGFVCGPYQEPAGSEGEDVPVGTEGDGDGGDDAESLEYDFICFHCVGVFDWLVDKSVVAERIVLPIVGHNDMVGHLCTQEGEGVDYALGELLVFC